MIRFSMILSIIVVLVAGTAFAGDKKSKVQEVNFEEMAMKGTIRNPEGSFLVQKKGLKFLPLVQVQKDMDQKIRSAEANETIDVSTSAVVPTRGGQ